MIRKEKNRHSKIKIDKTVQNQTNNEAHYSENDVTKNQEDILSEMVNQLDKICQILNSSNFHAHEVYNLLKTYDEKYHRVLYSAISDYIFKVMSNVSFDKGKDKNIIIQYNIMDLVAYADKQDNLKMKQITIKLYDHITLATSQYIKLKQSEEEYRDKFESYIEPVKNDIMRESSSQLLTLVGMFTALAFLIFGGISSLDNLFSEMNDLSILKLVALGCIWGICILNLIFVFLVCVSKMTYLPFSFSDKPNSNIIERYAVVWLCNLVLLILLIFSLGFLYIDKYKLNEWFVQWSKANPVFFFIAFISLLTLLLFIGLYFIFHKRKEKIVKRTVNCL